MKTFQLVLGGFMFFGLITATPGADLPLRAEIRQLQTKPNSNGDSDVAGFSAEFVLGLTNRSAMAVYLPSPDRDRGGSASRYSILSVEGRQPDGTWKYLIRASIYTFGQNTYAACKALAPGEAATNGEAVDVSLPKKELASMGTKPVLRFTLMSFCRQSDNQVHTATFATEPFDWTASTQ